MPGDTVFRRFAALPRAIVAHLIAAEPPQCRVFCPAKPGFAAIRSAAGCNPREPPARHHPTSRG